MLAATAPMGESDDDILVLRGERDGIVAVTEGNWVSN